MGLLTTDNKHRNTVRKALDHGLREKAGRFLEGQCHHCGKRIRKAHVNYCSTACANAAL